MSAQFTQQSTNILYVSGKSVALSGACGCRATTIFASDTWDSGSSYDGFTSSSADSLGPLSNQSVHFKGVQQGGNNTVYEYQIDCDEMCWITNVNIEGAAWYDSSMEFYNGDKSVLLGSQTTSGIDDNFRSYNIDMSANQNYGTQFVLIETGIDWTWRYRSSVIISQQLATPTGNQTTSPPGIIHN